MKRLTFLLSLMFLGFWPGRSAAAEAEAVSSHILVVVGPSSHPPGSHEEAAGARLLKHCLENTPGVNGVTVRIVNTWPTAEEREKASTAVFIGDTFPAGRFPNPAQNLADLEVMIQRGCGIVCVHYATGLLGKDVGPDGDHPLLRWLGGYFANRSCPHHESIARIFPSATITPAAPEHPISRGWDEFTIHDEPYIRNYFGKNGGRPAANVTVLATSLLPPESPQEEAVAWCAEGGHAGRGFAVVMPHFYKNWRDENLRRLILNGIVWTARREVPEGGVRSTLPDLGDFQPGAVEPAPAPPRKN